ncbi:MAG: hypothetical protein AAGF12_43625 [Myxococcota bacterium]
MWRLLPLSLLLAGCDSGNALLVDLRTDLAPVDEFAAVEVIVERGSGTQRLSAGALRSQDFFRGVRVAEYEDLEAGEYFVRARLLNGDGDVVLARQIRLDVSNDAGVTLIATRDCLGVSCPDSEDPTATECFAGRCTTPDCSSANRSACRRECVTVLDCVDRMGCTTPSCVEGACLEAMGCPSGSECQDNACVVAEPMDAGTEAGRSDANLPDGHGDPEPLCDGADYIYEGPPCSDATVDCTRSCANSDCRFECLNEDINCLTCLNATAIACLGEPGGPCEDEFNCFMACGRARCDVGAGGLPSCMGDCQPEATALNDCTVNATQMSSDCAASQDGCFSGANPFR